MTNVTRRALQEVKVLQPVCFVPRRRVSAKVSHPSPAAPPITKQCDFLVLYREQVNSMPEVGTGSEIALVKTDPRQLRGEALVPGTCLATVHRVLNV